jgi:hypothetical protein
VIIFRAPIALSVIKAKQRLSMLERETILINDRLQKISAEKEKWATFLEWSKELEDPEDRAREEPTSNNGVSSTPTPIVSKPSSGVPKLKNGTLAAKVAMLLKVAPGNELALETLKSQLIRAGVKDSKAFGTVVYTAMNRRQDIFEKVGRGKFKLRRLDFKMEG